MGRTGNVSRAVLKDKLVSDGRQLEEVSDCDDVQTPEQGHHVIRTFDLSQSPVDKAQRLVGDHADLINDDSVDVPPVSSQLVKLVGAQLAVPGAATVFHGQVEGPVDGQAADVEGGHTCRSH